MPHVWLILGCLIFQLLQICVTITWMEWMITTNSLAVKWCEKTCHIVMDRFSFLWYKSHYVNRTVFLLLWSFYEELQNQAILPWYIHSKSCIAGISNDYLDMREYEIYSYPLLNTSIYHNSFAFACWDSHAKCQNICIGLIKIIHNKNRIWWRIQCSVLLCFILSSTENG